MDQSEPLKQPLTLPCGAVLQNRLCKSAMTEGLATRDGVPTPMLSKLYELWSSSGAGLLITGNVMIDYFHLERPGNVVSSQSGCSMMVCCGKGGVCESARAPHAVPVCRSRRTQVERLLPNVGDEETSDKPSLRISQRLNETPRLEAERMRNLLRSAPQIIESEPDGYMMTVLNAWARASTKNDTAAWVQINHSGSQTNNLVCTKS